MSVSSVPHQPMCLSGIKAISGEGRANILTHPPSGLLYGSNVVQSQIKEIAGKGSLPFVEATIKEADEKDAWDGLDVLDGKDRLRLLVKKYKFYQKANVFGKKRHIGMPSGVRSVRLILFSSYFNRTAHFDRTVRTYRTSRTNKTNRTSDYSIYTFFWGWVA